MRRWVNDLELEAGRYQDLHARMSGLSATASSDLVSVTVDVNGVPTDLRLTDRARGVEPHTISADLMSCMRQAQVRLREQVTEMVHDTVGEDVAGEHIIDGYAQRFPGEAAPEPVSPDGPASADEDEDDEFYGRKSWLV